MNYILSFDVGTSSSKIVLYDENLKLVYNASKEYPTFYPKSGYAQQPAEQWWEAFCTLTKRCVEESGVEAKNIVAVGIDSMGSIALPVDRQGNALHHGLLWMDRRAHKQCADIDSRLGERLFLLTGNRNDVSNIAPKIMWFKDTHPEIYKNTYKFLHGNGYLVSKLTDVFTQDRTECGLTLLCEMGAKGWSDEITKTLGIDKDKLPDIYECQDVVGKVTKNAAQQTGLVEGTPVIAGAMDCLSTALGTCSIDEGDLFIAGGTVTAAGLVQNSANPHKLLHTHNHIIPGKYVTVSGVDFGGGGLRWFRDLLGDITYKELDELAKSVPAGNDGLIFLPYMVGQRSPLYNNNTSGVMFGLTPKHTRANMSRMFMEGTTYAVKNILEYYQVAGCDPICAKITGGLANSDIWTQMFSDILNVRVEHASAVDVATLGTAAAAAVGVGIYSDYNTALKDQKVKRAYEPNKANTRMYEKTYSLFKNVFNNILFSYEYTKSARQFEDNTCTET